MGMEKNNGCVDVESSEYLYEPELLKSLDLNNIPAQLKAARPRDEWLVVRPLRRSDYERGYLQLLEQLTHVGDVSRKQFNDRFSAMQRAGGYLVTVVEDSRVSRVIAAATLTIEHKFIHNCGLRGRLEDVVVNDTYRGKQLGKLVVSTAALLARAVGCYKMSLDCKDKLVPFYESLGYRREPGNANAMNMRFEDGS